MIAIVDYGLGNVKAFFDVYKKLNFDAQIVQAAGDLNKADKVILPGVGAFDHAMERLERSGMKTALNDLVINGNVPVLGVCVGMQVLADSSEEGKLPGLGWIKGEVKRFSPSHSNSLMRIPHMGWNSVAPFTDNGLFNGLDANTRFYFLHSYYFRCDQPENVLALTNYDGEFACAVQSSNIFGVQFHPEKSHHWGIKLLENFAKL